MPAVKQIKPKEAEKEVIPRNKMSSVKVVNVLRFSFLIYTEYCWRRKLKISIYFLLLPDLITPDFIPIIVICNKFISIVGCTIFYLNLCKYMKQYSVE